jgi:hypothetical protein
MVKNIVIVPVGSKGGFVLETRAGVDRSRSIFERGCRLLQGLSARTARYHRQPGRRRDRSTAGCQATRRR